MFEVLCDNKGSYQIAWGTGEHREVFGKPAVLVRCDRTDTEDNERGLALANRVKDFLNTLTIEEVQQLLADEMLPCNAFRMLRRPEPPAPSGFLQSRHIQG